MNEGFTSRVPSPPDPLAEVGQWQSKLDAAIDVVSRQIARINPQQQMALLTFDSTTAEIYRGLVSSFDRSALDSVRGSGNTDLAGALVTITDDPSNAPYPTISLLIITDGLPDDFDAAVASAQRLLDKLPQTRIDVILIDETDKGRATAQGVSLNGSVTYAYSALDVQQQAASAHVVGITQQLRASKTQRFALQQQLSQLAGTPSVSAFSVPTITSLSSDILRHQVVPLVECLESIDQTRCNLFSTAYAGRIVEISTSSPLQVLAAGLYETIRVVIDFITPRGREIRYRERELENSMRELELKKARQELEFEKRLEQRRQREFERIDELHQVEIQQRRIAAQLQEEKYRLASDVLHAFMEFARSRPEIGIDGGIAKLVKDIDQFLRLDLEIEMVAIGDIRDKDGPPKNRRTKR